MNAQIIRRRMLPPMTPEQEERSRRLQEMIRKACEVYAAMTPEQKKVHDDAQRESWVRGEMGLRDEPGW